MTHRNPPPKAKTAPSEAAAVAAPSARPTEEVIWFSDCTIRIRGSITVGRQRLNARTVWNIQHYPDMQLRPPSSGTIHAHVILGIPKAIYDAAKAGPKAVRRTTREGAVYELPGDFALPMCGSPAPAPNQPLPLIDFGPDDTAV